MVSTKIGTEKVEREAGYLYYIGKDGKVWQAPMKHNKDGKKKAATTESVTKEAGFMYFLGKDGYAYRAAMHTTGRPKGSKGKPKSS